MKKFLLTALTILVVLGVLGGAGFAGYRFGYQQGVLNNSDVDLAIRPFQRGDNFNWNHMPMHKDGFGPGMHRQGMGRGDFGSMHGRGGFGFVSPFFFLIRLAFYALLIWVIYKFFTGWRINFTRVEAPQETPKPEETTATKST